jgi:trehalose 6-phosphate phosphatase
METMGLPKRFLKLRKLYCPAAYQMNDQPRPVNPARSEGDLPPIDRSRTALFLDIDGTLLDIAHRPDAVDVPGDLPCDLVRLNRCLGGALALVSGRPLAEIDQLFAPLRLSAVGCHGAEIRAAMEEGISTADPLPETLRARLAALARRDPAIISEDKLYSFALHYRAVPELGPDLHAGVRAIAADCGLGSVELMNGKCVVELKSRGFNKGTGLRALMAIPPFKGRKPVYVGDDMTDQDALRVVPEFGGFGIGVGRALAGVGFVFDVPEDVRSWLGNIAAQEECS